LHVVVSWQVHVVALPQLQVPPPWQITMPTVEMVIIGVEVLIILLASGFAHICWTVKVYEVEPVKFVAVQLVTDSMVRPVQPGTAPPPDTITLQLEKTQSADLVPSIQLMYKLGRLVCAVTTRDEGAPAGTIGGMAGESRILPPVNMALLLHA